MKRVVLAAAALLVAGGSALAADTCANLYGNTITITTSDGARVTAYVNADIRPIIPLVMI